MVGLFHRFATIGILLSALSFSASVMAVSLESVLESRRAIVQYQAQHESANASIKENKNRIDNLAKKNDEIEADLNDVRDQINGNEKLLENPGYSDLHVALQKKNNEFNNNKNSLIRKKRENSNKIKELKRENNNLVERERNAEGNADKERASLKRLKQSYLESQVSIEIAKAERGMLVIEEQKVSCTFVEFYGVHKGNKQFCLKRAIDLVKDTAAAKYAPTNITSEIESHDFEITAERSSEYYSVDVSIKKEIASSVVRDNEAERLRATFKAEILIKPAFTKKTRRKLMERFEAKLGGEIGKVTKIEKGKTFAKTQARIEHEEKAKSEDRLSSGELDYLRQEIEALKKAQSAQQINQQLDLQQEAQSLEQQEKSSKRKAEEARIQQEIERRLRDEKKRSNKQAERAEEEESIDVFMPPIF